MAMKSITIVLLAAFEFIAISSCRQHVTVETEQTPVVSVKTIAVKTGDIESSLSLNGKTTYLKKNTIISPISGYIVKMNIRFGDKVKKNDILFEIQTKENKALENSGTMEGNAGIIKVTASSDGLIDELNISGTGFYITEGGTLCTISEYQDLMVLVNVPYEYNSLVKSGAECKITLSDNSGFKGTVYRKMPAMNEVSQTQNVLIKPDTKRELPENLNLTVIFVTAKHTGSFLVPKEAVMTNETQTQFWIMKIFSDSLAVKIPVQLGIANDSIVEILSSGLSKNDLTIYEGAYGLPDSTVVRIVN
jgi:hypothetical protein